MDLSKRLGIIEQQEEKESNVNYVTDTVQVNTDSFNNNFKLDEDFRVCPTDAILSDHDVVPVLDEVNNYTILLKEMNKESVGLPNDDCHVGKSTRDKDKDTNVTDISDYVHDQFTSEECNESEVNDEKSDCNVAAENDNYHKSYHQVCIDNLEEQTKKKVKPKVTKCSYCQKFFTSSNLHRHMRRIHSELFSSPESSNFKIGLGKKVYVNVDSQFCSRT